jgi:ribonuclease VapC
MTRYVIDASALIAYFLDETGGHKLEGYLKAGTCMSTINWAEVLSKGYDLGQDIDKVSTLVKSTGPEGEGIKFFPVMVEDAQNIGVLRSATKKLGLSLGDRACLALALRLNLPAVTADSSWLKLRHTIKVISIR